MAEVNIHDNIHNVNMEGCHALGYAGMLQRIFEPNSMRIISISVYILAFGALAACSEGGTLPEGSRSSQSLTEFCEGSGFEVKTVDVNNDKRPDIRHMYEGNKERCVQYDMNYDGKIDVSRSFDKDGRSPLREEHDFDFDGKLDQITYYKNGQLVHKELDTNFDNTIDVWVWCSGKAVTKANRARHHYGRVDTWEFYQAGQLRGIAYDDNNDSRPEKWEVYRNGQVVTVKEDTNDDGKPDRSEPFPAESAGQAEEPVSCDGTPFVEPEPSPAAPATKGATP